MKITLSADKTKAVENGYDGLMTIFVDFKTSEGVFQIAVYNAHNGYYGHNILIRSTQLHRSEDL